MPKLKTNRSAAKRFRVTGSGKIRILRRPGRSHLLAHKSAKRKRRLRAGKPLLTAEDARLVRRHLGI